ncbi:MAG: hypothetical protein CVV27_01960 [Candidatus Melainabacteria bacterium HGW-Melainabacteria-1]|nr:MAG: hypothetical protein CVV27_01960 [Candidatus Melainabacteria bacterium HGW-Melainabacteria-1]
MLIRSHLRFVPPSLPILFLSACQFLQVQPTADNRPSDANSLPVRNAAFNLKADGYQQPEMLTFPLMVQLQAMTPLQTLPKGKMLDVNLTTTTGRLGHDEIRVPANGAFRVAFQAGKNFKILDSEATDGLAIVQLPEDSYSGYVGAEITDTSRLVVEDKFYYVKQEILPGGTTPIDLNGKKPAMQFYQFGARSLPIPSSWRNPDGQNLVLSFSNQGVNQAAMRWYPSSMSAQTPPGIKEIGPAGGIIELPGVAKFEIPPSALSTNHFISMTQVLSAPNRRLKCSGNQVLQTCTRGEEYLSGVVKIEPLGLDLSVPSSLSLEVDYKRYEGVPSQLVGVLATTDLSGSKDMPPFFYKQDVFIGEPVVLKKLAYFAKVIDSRLFEAVNQGNVGAEFGVKPNSFTSSRYFDSQYFRIVSMLGNEITEIEGRMLSKYFEKAYAAYNQLGVTKLTFTQKSGDPRKG